MSAQGLTKILKRNALDIRASLEKGQTVREALQPYLSTDNNINSMVALWSRIERENISFEQISKLKKPRTPKHAAANLRKLVRESLQPDPSQFDEYITVDEFKREVLRSIELTNATTTCHYLRSMGIPVTVKKLNVFYDEEMSSVDDAVYKNKQPHKKIEAADRTKRESPETKSLVKEILDFEKEEKRQPEQAPASGTRQARDQGDVD